MRGNDFDILSLAATSPMPRPLQLKGTRSLAVSGSPATVAGSRRPAARTFFSCLFPRFLTPALAKAASMLAPQEGASLPQPALLVTRNFPANATAAALAAGSSDSGLLKAGCQCSKGRANFELEFPSVWDLPVDPDFSYSTWIYYRPGGRQVPRPHCHRVTRDGADTQSTASSPVRSESACQLGTLLGQNLEP